MLAVWWSCLSSINRPFLGGVHELASFILLSPKKKTTTTITTHIPVQKKCRKSFTDVKSAFSQLITSHIQRVLHRLSTHPCCSRISVKVPWPIFTSVRGASPIQPPLEPDYPCLKTFPADLVTYNLNMKCCAHKLWGAMDKISERFLPWCSSVPFTSYA